MGPTDDRRAVGVSPSVTPQPLPDRPLSHRLPVDPALREELLGALKQLGSVTFERYHQPFIESLSPFDRKVYTRAAEAHPYAEKDWYRNPHDIIVVSAMRRLVTEEKLPPWLVTAAILHDRGYGILAHKGDATAAEYQQRGGAHWENRDTRLLHSHLSTQFAGELIFGELGQESRAIIPPRDRDAFLSVIEKHDHPLIGEYEALPPVGRHHFDADSLFSISLLSFVKDYLSYCADEKKLEKAQAAGICNDEGLFTPTDLLQARIARYYVNESDLPSDWPLRAVPLNNRALTFTEGGRCYVPHSETAHRLTDIFFNDLLICSSLFQQKSSIREVVEELSSMVASQVDVLLGARAEDSGLGPLCL